MNTIRFALPLAILLGGCATFGNAVIPAIATTAGLASEWAVKKFPDRRVAFTTAEKALTMYLAEETLTVEKLIDVLQTAGLDSTGWAGPSGDLYIQAGLVVWQLASSINHVIANNTYVMLFGTEIRDGFRRGLLEAPAPIAPGLLRAAPGLTTLTPSTVPYSPREHIGKRVVL